MTRSKTGPRVLVAQIGARRGYAVPRALAQAGCLQTLVTDACDVVQPWSGLARVPEDLRPSALCQVLLRRADGVPKERIQGRFGFFLSRHLGRLRRRHGEPASSHWFRQNQAFGGAVARMDWGITDTVYAFNGAALEIFVKARQRGALCVLDQTAAPWRYNHGILEREQARWPGWEDCPADLDRSGDMIAREEAEWALADRIICGSSFVVDAIRKVGGPFAKCCVVPYATPVAPYRLTRTARPREGRLRVLFVGTLQLRKGIQYLWDAAGRLGHHGFEFRAVGPSHLTPEAHDAVSSRVDCRGRVDRHEIWKHYGWADVFLLPTLSEGSANVCWEAVAAGVTLVTTHAAGIVDPSPTIVDLDSDDIAPVLTALAAEVRTLRSPTFTQRSLADYGAHLMRSMTSGTIS